MSEPTSRPVPHRSPAYRALTLGQVRAVVGALDRERQDVAYWMRVLDARSAAVSAGSEALPGSGADLSSRLADARRDEIMNRIRSLDVRAVRDVAPFDLPDLAELWRRPLPPDRAGQCALMADIASAKDAVQRYALEVQHRYDDAKRELIARYRDDCAAAFELLPGHGRPL
jgi:hypothetical protein